MDTSLETLRVLPPAHGFGALREALERNGWRLLSHSSAPIVPGEPEQASFAHGERALHYTFNPVCRLRLLDGARAGGWPDGVPRVDPAEVAAWLADGDERTALRGILAAQALRATALAPAVQALVSHPRAALAQAATRALTALETSVTEPGPRETALAAADVLRQRLEPLLLDIARDPGGALAVSLRPREDDWDRVFVPACADRAREAYAAAWPETPRVRRASAQARVRVYLAPAGMLATDNELSRAFPGGYRAIADHLQPQRVWAAWKVIEPGASAGMAYDGLVWVDDHWAWFPKPYRVLAGLVAGS